MTKPRRAIRFKSPDGVFILFLERKSIRAVKPDVHVRLLQEERRVVRDNVRARDVEYAAAGAVAHHAAAGPQNAAPLLDVGKLHIVIFAGNRAFRQKFLSRSEPTNPATQGECAQAFRIPS